ncbi:unnamed protein product [Aphanomyces euteiches]
MPCLAHRNKLQTRRKCILTRITNVDTWISNCWPDCNKKGVQVHMEKRWNRRCKCFKYHTSCKSAMIALEAWIREPFKSTLDFKIHERRDKRPTNSILCR